ncbi:hypothetical protein [Actinoplanes sp. NPDC051494]|uniref:hypothetical protein n=1 Tax=Actinoplanes sp. NPDC051494 TaxID=3363907 RepID=UPI0037BAA723
MTAFLTGLALFISIIAALAAISSAHSGKRSAAASEKSETHAGNSAVSAKESVAEARRSADATERGAAASEQSVEQSARSAKAAEESSEHAEVSAKAARDSAEAAQRLTRAEVERDHRDLHPRDLNARFFYERTTVGDRLVLFFTFTPLRTYRCKGQTVSGTSSSPLGLPLVAEAGKRVKVQVADMTNRDKPAYEMLEMQFWPPLDVDKGGDWECPCDRNADPEKGAHWDWNVEIEPPDKPVDPWIAMV